MLCIALAENKCRAARYKCKAARYRRVVQDEPREEASELLLILPVLLLMETVLIRMLDRAFVQVSISSELEA